MILRNKYLFVAALFVAGGLAWTTFIKTMLDRHSPLKVEYLPSGPIPDFTLTESHGQPITRADLKGKVWVADLIFTSCGSTCPMLSATMSKLDRALGPRDDVRLVSISVTPEYDTPDVLRAYAGQFQASDKWLFLTGDRAQIVKLANSGFWLSAGSLETLTHSDKFVLVDGGGKVRGFFDGTKSESVPPLLEQIKKMTRQR